MMIAYRHPLLLLLIFSLAGCEKLPIPSEKPIKLNCHGRIDRGVFSDALTKNSVETINSDITLSIGKGYVEMHGDGTEGDFWGNLMVCSSGDVISMRSDRCESSVQQRDRLLKLYKDDERKIAEVLDFDANHISVAEYNRISKSLYVSSKSSSCHQDKKGKSCGLYADGKYACQMVNNLD